MIYRDLSLPSSSVIKATIKTLSTVFTSDENLTVDATFYWPKFMFFVTFLFDIVVVSYIESLHSFNLISFLGNKKAIMVGCPEPDFMHRISINLCK